MNRASFLKLLALPVVAPLVVLSTKIRGHWREEFARDVWVGSDGSETPAEEMGRLLDKPVTVYRFPRYLICRPDDVEVSKRIIEASQ